MSVEHDSFVLALPALVRGRLGGERRQAVEEHLLACEDCREMHEAIGIVAAATLHPAAAATLHPQASELVAHALGEDSADEAPKPAQAGARVALEAHLGSCDVCARAVEATRIADREAAPREPPRAGVSAARRAERGWMRPALAAGFTAVLLGYPAWRGVRDLWTSPVPGPRGGPGPEGGPVALFMLAEPMRSDAAPVTSVVADGPRVLLAFVPPAEAQGGCRIAIGAPAGAAGFETSLSAEDVKRHLARASVVTLEVPIRGLAAGDLELRAFCPAGDPVPAVRIPFTLERP